MTLRIMQANLGIPQIVDENDIVVYGLFLGRRAHAGWKTCCVLAEGDIIEDIGMTVRGGRLVSSNAKEQ